MNAEEPKRCSCGANLNPDGSCSALVAAPVNAEDLAPILVRGTADDPNIVPEQEPFQFQVAEGEEPTLETFVFQALGAASSCWSNLSGAGTFDSTRAKEIGDVLCATIRGSGYWNDTQGYTVELGGQKFTQAQWEAVQTMFGPPREQSDVRRRDAI